MDDKLNQLKIKLNDLEIKVDSHHLAFKDIDIDMDDIKNDIDNFKQDYLILSNELNNTTKLTNDLSKILQNYNKKDSEIQDLLIQRTDKLQEILNIQINENKNKFINLDKIINDLKNILNINSDNSIKWKNILDNLSSSIKSFESKYENVLKFLNNILDLDFDNLNGILNSKDYKEFKSNFLSENKKENEIKNDNKNELNNNNKLNGENDKIILSKVIKNDNSLPNISIIPDRSLWLYYKSNQSNLLKGYLASSLDRPRLIKKNIHLLSTVKDGMGLSIVNLIRSRLCNSTYLLVHLTKTSSIIVYYISNLKPLNQDDLDNIIDKDPLSKLEPLSSCDVIFKSDESFFFHIFNNGDLDNLHFLDYLNYYKNLNNFNANKLYYKSLNKLAVNRIYIYLNEKKYFIREFYSNNYNHSYDSINELLDNDKLEEVRIYSFTN